jgi:serum/glucocorticoid-regulated kinase 2
LEDDIFDFGGAPGF